MTAKDKIIDAMAADLLYGNVEGAKELAKSLPGAFDAYVIDQQEQRELARLSDKLNAFCDQHGLPHEYADEILSSLYHEEPRREELCQWLKGFIEEWEAVA